MQRSCAAVARTLIGTRGFCTSNSDKIVASVLFERLPVVVPKIDPVVYAFQEFSGKGDYQIDYVPAPRVTEADKTNDKRSLQRALDRRLYLLLHGKTVLAPDGRSVWHFPEKVYKSEETLRKCAESALKSVIGDLSNTYFVGNAPMGHMVVQPTENAQDLQSCKFSDSRIQGFNLMGIVMSRNGNVFLLGRGSSIAAGHSLLHGTLRLLELLFEIQGLHQWLIFCFPWLVADYEVMECSGRMFICAVCQVDLALSEGISVHAGESISVHAGSIFSMSSKPWQGPFLCTDCMPWKENEWS
ncbi:hypothetical protein RHMOL_Rhmol09G0152700 [Rhododendron molle]|uniref:Uncharacterized protein n=1 Tax=Rhododendron molle TaxID=49168 RepID=A0ACC0MDD8_RHOML|nr:hypothetical protein RHMOL_Rhmol09G0152700 [Rhododendron molle]